MRPLESKNNCPKIKICFGYVKLHDILVIVKKGGNPGVYLQIYSYISSSLSLNTKTWYHSPKTSDSTIHLKLHSVIHHYFLAFSLACFVSSVQQHLAWIPQQSSLCCALYVLTTLFYWCGAPHLGPGFQALKEGSLR